MLPYIPSCTDRYWRPSSLLFLLLLLLLLLQFQFLGVDGRKLVLAIDGGTESIRAGLFDAENGSLVSVVGIAPYQTLYPHPGWAEQNPQDWWDNLGIAVRQAVTSWKDSGVIIDVDTICAMALDTTCCSVVALDKDYVPVLPCLLWMDQRSAQEAARIVQMAVGDPALKMNHHGAGPVSAEWMTPKALWLATSSSQHRDLWESNTIQYVCEYQDYLNLCLTGKLCASACNAATRWHWDGNCCTNAATPDNPYPGRPISFYRSIGIPELADKLPQLCYPMGTVIGPLTSEAAKHLNLPSGIPVVQGGPDAFVGMIGLGCIHPGQMCLITGSSHLHCVVAESAATAPGIWGAYRGAPLPNMMFAEGGQSSTGSILRWVKHHLLSDDQDLTYSTLDQEAATIAPGADGLIVLETFQGSRTPVTDPLARGAFFRLTLSHTRAHIWRACLEAVCYGTRSCIEALADAGHECHEIILAGGVTRSPLWLQMHADVTGIPIVLCEGSDNAPLLGCAILASFGAGVHPTIASAVKSMVRTTSRVLPTSANKNIYDEIYIAYLKAVQAARQLSQTLPEQPTSPSVHPNLSRQVDNDDPHRRVTISPSLLACDWTDIRSEVKRCIDAGLVRLHVDIFDGVYLNSPQALTFGPQMVAAIRKSCGQVNVQLDLHVCVERPERYVKAMAEAGGSVFIFQWEAMNGSIETAVELCQSIRAAGMVPGISINPSSSLEDLFPFLLQYHPLVGVVDILAVEPGYGGQTFQTSCLDKINSLSSWRTQHRASFEVMVDGGINLETARPAMEYGANILVTGTFLFQSSHNIGAAALDLLQKIQEESTTTRS